MDLETYKKNPKTAFLAEHFEKLLKDEAEVRAMMEKDPTLKEMAEADLVSILAQKKELEDQMKGIIEADKEVIEVPNEVVLEVRAGAGGEEGIGRFHLQPVQGVVLVGGGVSVEVPL